MTVGGGCICALCGVVKSRNGCIISMTEACDRGIGILLGIPCEIPPSVISRLNFPDI